MVSRGGLRGERESNEENGDIEHLCITPWFDAVNSCV